MYGCQFHIDRCTLLLELGFGEVTVEEVALRVFKLALERIPSGLFPYRRMAAGVHVRPGVLVPVVGKPRLHQCRQAAVHLKPVNDFGHEAVRSWSEPKTVSE